MPASKQEVSHARIKYFGKALTPELQQEITMELQAVSARVVPYHPNQANIRAPIASRLTIEVDTKNCVKNLAFY